MPFKRGEERKSRSRGDCSGEKMSEAPPPWVRGVKTSVVIMHRVNIALGEVQMRMNFNQLYAEFGLPPNQLLTFQSCNPGTFFAAKILSPPFRCQSGARRDLFPTL